jgi:hypothetical protein
MVFTIFGGFASAGLHVHLMQMIGWLMIALCDPFSCSYRHASFSHTRSL